MKKLAIFLLTLLLSVTAFYLFADSNQANEVQNQKEVLNKINQQLKIQPTLVSKFIQQNSIDKGKMQAGWFVLSRKTSQARIDYNSQNLRFIVSNHSIMIQQINLHQKSFIPLDNNPLNYILKPQITFENHPNFEIVSMTSNHNNYILTIKAMGKNQNIYYIVFKFNKKNYHLQGWTIQQPNQEITTVQLIDPIFSNKAIPQRVFNTHRVTHWSYQAIAQLAK